jgi:hypothetical protein
MADIWGTLDMADDYDLPSWLEARLPPYMSPRAEYRGVNPRNVGSYSSGFDADAQLRAFTPYARSGPGEASLRGEPYSIGWGTRTPGDDAPAPTPYVTDMPGEASPPSAQQFMGVQSATPQATPSWLDAPTAPTQDMPWGKAWRLYSDTHPQNFEKPLMQRLQAPWNDPEWLTKPLAQTLMRPDVPAAMPPEAMNPMYPPQASEQNAGDLMRAVGGQGAPPIQGAAQQFMGVSGQGKDQSRMPMYGGPQPGVKGDPWQSPGGASQPPQGGGGAPSGGGAPQHQGPVTMQGVMQSLAQSNPDMMKTREGRITLGMAALKFAPLMHQQDQMEMQRMKMELANQIQMLKLSQGEAHLGIQQQRADAYEAKMKSGVDPSKSLENAIKERDAVANHLAQQPNSKELRQSYNEAQKRVDGLNKKVNPQGVEKEYSSWLEEAAGSSNPVEKALTSVPQYVISKIRPEEQRQLGEMLITEPIKAHMRIMKLIEKLRGGETTVGKSDGNY